MVDQGHDQMLVEKARTGDQAAFSELCELHRSRLESRIRSILGQRLRKKLEVDDVLQGSFMKAFETIDRFQWRTQDSFFHWVSSIAEHLILTASQKKAFEELQLECDIAGRDRSPSKHMARKERFDRLKNSLESLTPDQTRVIHLVHFQGRSTREVARLMDRSEDAVRQLLSRALMRLRRSFGDTESLHLPDASLNDRSASDEST